MTSSALEPTVPEKRKCEFTKEVEKAFMDNLRKNQVEEIPEGTKKLTFYNSTKRESTFTVRHYYVDLKNNYIYRYYPGFKIITKSNFKSKKNTVVISDDDKPVTIYNGPKLMKHLENENEFWSKDKVNDLLIAWK